MKKLLLLCTIPTILMYMTSNAEDIGRDAREAYEYLIDKTAPYIEKVVENTGRFIDGFSEQPVRK